MTRAEKETRLQELREFAESKTVEYNSAMLEAKFEEAVAIDEETEKAVNEYTALARTICFEDCAAAEDPMLEAVKRLCYPTIRIKDSKVGEEKVPVREIVDVEKQIDILKLHKFVEGGIGADPKWNLVIEQFNLLLTLQAARDIGADPKEINDSYAMSDLAKEIDLGKNPTSKTNMLKTLTQVVQAMIGEEYKPVSHDVNFLMKVYTRKSRKALTVTCGNHRYLRGYLMEVCHRIVMGERYDVDYKQKRK